VFSRASAGVPMLMNVILAMGSTASAVPTLPEPVMTAPGSLNAPSAPSAVGAAGALSAAAAAPSPAQIRAAVTALRADPNLGKPHSMRSLQWVRSKAPPPPDSPTWILGLFEFLGQTASLLLWIAGSAVAALAVIWIGRLLRASSSRTARPQQLTVSRIGGLDIRPASLPDDVGAAALALLEAGRTRDALSLLYRGALSRAVHRHGVAIHESFTEGEALRAVESRLDSPRVAYFRELLGLWQRAMYAGQATAVEPVAALCASFGATLGGATLEGAP
jgi:hypothetical protein